MKKFMCRAFFHISKLDLARGFTRVNVNFVIQSFFFSREQHFFLDETVPFLYRW